MPTASPAPNAASLVLYEGEYEYLHPDLDAAYITGTAVDVAGILRDDRTAEVAYQPGDHTYYGIVIVPLRTLHRAKPRVTDHEWDAHGVRGMLDEARANPDLTGLARINSMPHRRDAYLVCNTVAGRLFPVILDDQLASWYVGENLDYTMTSAVSVTVLLRAIAVELAS